MATGSMTAAYRCRVIDGVLVQTSTTYPSSMCDSIDDALIKLASGDVVVVAGGDKAALNERLVKLGVELGQ